MTTNNSATATASGGIGFFGLLTIVLVVLKALGYLNISWWLVFTPLFVGWGIALIFLLIFLVIVIVSD